MIKREAEIGVYKVGDKIYFASREVDLSKESLILPVEVKGKVGTVEFFVDKVIFHPADGDDVEYAPEAIMEIAENGEIEWG